MRLLRLLAAAAVLSLSMLGTTSSVNAASIPAACEGTFPNPITDICWSCVYPIKLFGTPMFGQQGEDFDTGFDNPVCFCDNPPQVGVSTSFWEPVYMTEVTTIPWCFPLLAGLQLDVPVNTTKLGITDDQSRGDFNSNTAAATFRWVHGYTNPLMYVLDVLLDNACTTKGSLSPEWPTEVDPGYDDWEISTTMNPISFAVANMTAIVVGTADAISALVDFPRPELFWVAGSWGNIYPYTGWVYPHITNEMTSRLLSTRLLAWQHEFKSMAAFYGPENSCSDYGSWQPIMDKRQYKFSRLLPFPQTEKINGNCCGPIGRSTILVESGTEVPASSYRDFGYVIFRKRDCCSGAWP